MRRIVHEKTFADKFGPVDDAIRDSALVLHGAQYITNSVFERTDGNAAGTQRVVPVTGR